MEAKQTWSLPEEVPCSEQRGSGQWLPAVNVPTRGQ